MRPKVESGRYVHIIKRGARGMNIVRDDADRWRFLRLLRYLNDAGAPRNWERDVSIEHVKEGFTRPSTWREPEPYVSLIAYCLMDNHFHLVVEEREEAGISKFMQRLCTSMSLYFNAKYDERGTLFQGVYKAVPIDSDEHLQYLAAYIQVKNPFERYPDGYAAATRHFDKALEWATHDPFSSLGDYLGKRQYELLDHALMEDLMTSPRQFTVFARDVILGRRDRMDEIDRYALDT